jgi:hypothetical protein
MAEKNPYSDQRREQHPATFNDNPPAKTVAKALINAKQQVDKAK